MQHVDPRSVTEVDREIGARVRARRQELGYSQAYVADVIGITFQQMQKYEAGQNRVASATLLRIAEALNSDPMSLLTGGKKAAAGPRRPKASEDPLMLHIVHVVGQFAAQKQSEDQAARDAERQARNVDRGIEPLTI